MGLFSRKIILIDLLTGFYALVMAFHLLVITRIIPFSIVWGGKLESEEDMFRFETVSILVNTFFIVILRVKRVCIQEGIKNRWISGFLWLFMVLFVANTAGNILAESLLERLVFTPLTLLSAILIYHINKG